MHGAHTEDDIVDGEWEVAHRAARMAGDLERVAVMRMKTIAIEDAHNPRALRVIFIIVANAWRLSATISDLRSLPFSSALELEDATQNPTLSRVRWV